MDKEAMYNEGYYEGVRECEMIVKDRLEMLRAENDAFWRELCESAKVMDRVTQMLPVCDEAVKLREQAAHLNHLINAKRIHGGKQ